MSDEKDTIEASVVNLSTDDERVVYELGYHLLPVLTDEKAAEASAEIKALIEKHEGACFTEEAPKSVPLAYTIVQSRGGKRVCFSRAFFGWMKCDIPTTSAPAISVALRENENVLRFLLIRTVRESTLAPKRVFFERTETPAAHLAKPSVKAPVKPAMPAMSDAELDKTIEELVVE